MAGGVAECGCPAMSRDTRPGQAEVISAPRIHSADDSAAGAMSQSQSQATRGPCGIFVASRDRPMPPD